MFLKAWEIMAFALNNNWFWGEQWKCFHRVNCMTHTWGKTVALALIWIIDFPNDNIALKQLENFVSYLFLKISVEIQWDSLLLNTELDFIVIW